MPKTLPRKDSPVFEQEYTPVREKSQTEQEARQNVWEEMEQQDPRPYDPASPLKRLVYLLKACESHLSPEAERGPLLLAIRVLSGCVSTRSFASVQRYLAPVEERLTERAQDFVICHRTEPGTSMKTYRWDGKLIRKVIISGTLIYKVRNETTDALLERRLMRLFTRPPNVNRDVMRIIDMIIRVTKDQYERSLVSLYDVTVQAIPFRHFFSDGGSSIIARYFDFRMYATSEELDDFYTHFLGRVEELCEDEEDPGPWQEGEEPWPGKVAARFVHNVDTLRRRVIAQDIDEPLSLVNVEVYARTTQVLQVQVRFFLSEVVAHINFTRRLAFVMGLRKDAPGRASNESPVRILSVPLVMMILKIPLAN
jgi:hypothetical protein